MIRKRRLTHPLRYNLLLAFFLAWGGVALAGSLLWPMGFDQGSFAWVGDLILRGGVPYRDAWEVKGPATYYTYAACQALLGRNYYGIRLLDALLIMLAAWAMRRLLTGWVRRPWADLGALLFLFLYLRTGYWNTANSDGYAMMLMTGAAALVIRKEPVSLARHGAAGLLAGLALMYKITFAALLAPPLLFLLVQAWPRPRRALPAAAVYLAGAGLMAGGWILFLAWNGGLAGFIEINRFMNAVYRTSHHHTLAGHIQALFHELKNFWPLAPPALYALYSSSRNVVIHSAFRIPHSALEESANRNPQFSPHSALRALKVFCLAWFVLGLATVIVQSKYYTYHYLILVPPLVLLAALGLEQLLPRRRAPLLKVAAVLILFFCRPELNTLAFHALATEHRLGPRYEARFLAHMHVSCALSRRAANTIERLTAPGDTIQVWGWDNLLYDLSGRACATRFGFIHPLVQSFDRGDEASLKKYLAEFMTGLRKNKPKIIVIARRDKNNLTRRRSDHYLALPAFREVSDYIETHYAKAAVIKNYAIWMRNPGS